MHTLYKTVLLGLLACAMPLRAEQWVISLDCCALRQCYLDEAGQERRGLRHARRFETRATARQQLEQLPPRLQRLNPRLKELSGR